MSTASIVIALIGVLAPGACRTFEPNEHSATRQMGKGGAAAQGAEGGAAGVGDPAGNGNVVGSGGAGGGTGGNGNVVGSGGASGSSSEKGGSSSEGGLGGVPSNAGQDVMGGAGLGEAGLGGDEGTSREPYNLENTFDGKAQLGATSLMPFVQDETPHVLIYSSNTGIVSFNRIASAARGVTPVWQWDHWSVGFSHFEPHYVGTAPQLVGYIPTTGELHLAGFRPNLQGPDTKLITAITPNYTHVSTYSADGAWYILWYMMLSGQASVHRVTEDGASATQVFSQALDWGATHIIPFSTESGATFLFFDASRERLSVVDAAPDHLELLDSRAFAEPLQHVVAFVDGERPFFLTYANDGSIAIFEIDLTNLALTLAWRGRLPAGATRMSALTGVSAPHFMLYDGASGRVRLYRVDRTRAE